MASARMVNSQLHPTKEIATQLLNKVLVESPFFGLGHFFGGEAPKVKKDPWRTRIHFPNFPLVYKESEKVAKSGGGSRKIVFETLPNLTKPEISQFIKKVYGLEVSKVNTMNVEERRQPKMKGSRGRHWTSVHTHKKVIITIAPPPARPKELRTIEKIREVIPEIAATIPNLPSWLQKEGDLDWKRQQQHLRLVRRMSNSGLLKTLLKKDHHTTTAEGKEEAEAKAIVTTTKGEQPKDIIERVIREVIPLSKPKRKWWTARRV